MEISEAKQLRTQLEQDVLKLLLDFESKTKLSIEDITISHYTTISDGPKVGYLRIGVEL